MLVVLQTEKNSFEQKQGKKIYYVMCILDTHLFLIKNPRHWCQISGFSLIDFQQAISE